VESWIDFSIVAATKTCHIFQHSLATRRQISFSSASDPSTITMDFTPGPRSVFCPQLPFNERWEPLKPHLERFYLDEKLKLPKITAIMKEQYGFDAK
jgi:hypothetical protein